MLRQLLTACISTAAVLCTYAQSVTIDVTPGSLYSHLCSNNIKSGSIIVKGNIDARDINSIARVPLDTVDLSNVHIQAFASNKQYFYGSRSFEENIIPDNSFALSPIKVLILPNEITTIGENAFAGAALTAIKLPDNLKNIGDCAFAGCNYLEDIVFPSSLTHIGAMAFMNCHSLTNVDIANTKIKSICEQTFYNCIKLNTLTLPPSVSDIGELAFAGTALQHINTSSIVTAEDFSFAQMPSLTTSTAQISEPAPCGLYFGDTNLKTISQQFIDIPAATFAYSKYINVDEVAAKSSTIGDFAFFAQRNNIVTLSEGVSSLGEGVFSGSQYLQLINCYALKGNIPVVNEKTFNGINKSIVKVYVTPEDYDKWKQAAYWNELQIIDDLSGIETIANSHYEVNYKDKQIFVRSDELLLNVNIYTVGGQLLTQSVVNNYNAEIPIDTSEKILIVIGQTSTHTYTNKLITH